MVDTESKIPEQEPTVEKDGIAGFAKQVLRYFQDFIQTDFKRQQAPRRRIVFKSDTKDGALIKTAL